jgi:hypothetical protein
VGRHRHARRGRDLVIYVRVPIRIRICVRVHYLVVMAGMVSTIMMTVIVRVIR